MSFSIRFFAAVIGVSFLAAAAPIASIESDYSTPSQSIDARRELFITAVAVVDDPRARGNGPWSFGGLMTALSGEIRSERFAESWIRTLVATPVVNQDPTMAGGTLIEMKEEAMSRFFDLWRNRSKGSEVDLSTAPFRLLAIVNRPDLLSIRDGRVESAGEARLIFQSVDPEVADIIRPGAGNSRFFVIFEYELPASNCSELKEWSERWHNLSLFPVESQRFKSALEAITARFTLPDPGSGRPNGSFLNQLRSNEFNLPPASIVWDLREWNLVAPAATPDSWVAVLQSVTTKQTPSFSYLMKKKRNDNLGRWLTANADDILAGQHAVETEIGVPGSPKILGGIAVNDLGLQKLVPPSNKNPVPASGTLWWAEGYSNIPETDEEPGYIVTERDARVRHKFALQTCSGCHFAESGTDRVVVSPGTGIRQSFSMVSVRDYREESSLSPFLTGTGDFPDPVNPVARTDNGQQVNVDLNFNDLERRKSVLRRILNLECAPGLGSPDPIAELSDLAAEAGTRVH